MNLHSLTHGISKRSLVLVALVLVSVLGWSAMDDKQSNNSSSPSPKQQAPQQQRQQQQKQQPAGGGAAQPAVRPGGAGPKQQAPQQQRQQQQKQQPAGGGAAQPAVRPGGAGSAGSGGGAARNREGTAVRGGTGPFSYVRRPGDQARVLPGGRTEFRNANGQTVTTNARGEVHRIEASRGLAGGNKMVITHAPGGGRIVETGRPGARVVNYGPRRGFVEHPLRPGYISRTYVVGGHTYAHVYREYRYNNVVYYQYVPAVYYGPQFYAWAVTPWAAPMPYAWFGLATPAPWFGFYAGYFTPYQIYASPDLWLTDYVLAENLRLAYENQQVGDTGQAQPPFSAQPTAATISPEMKALIADEVRQQLAADKGAALQSTSACPQQPASESEQLPPALSQGVFVVSSDLDITTAAGQACMLTPGDIIQRKGTEVTADGGVVVEVSNGKPGDCAAGSVTTVQLADLQEMDNQLKEQVDSGLKRLAENQAKGLPSGPAASARPCAEGTAEPVSDAEAQLATQEADAAKLEAQVKQTGGGN